MPSNSRNKKPETEEDKRFHVELARQMLTLATAAFGLAAALAWNSLIQEFLNNFLKPRIGGGVLISGLIYALVVTALAVTVTYQLSKLVKRLENKS